MTKPKTRRWAGHEDPGERSHTHTHTSFWSRNIKALFRDQNSLGGGGGGGGLFLFF